MSAPACGSDPTILAEQKRRVSSGSRGKVIAFTRRKKGESDSPRGLDPGAGVTCKRGNYRQKVPFLRVFLVARVYSSIVEWPPGVDNLPVDVISELMTFQMRGPL